METQFSLLLCVVPGYISRKIYKQINDVSDDLSTFEETLYCLIFSGVISFVSLNLLVILWLGSGCDYSELTYVTLKSYFNNLKFVTIYIIMSMILSIGFAFLINPLMKAYIWLVNFYRRKTNKPQVVLNQSVFDTIFNNKDGVHYVEIHKDDKLICRGLLKSSVEKYKELSIELCEEGIDNIIASLEWEKPKYKHIYYDCKTGLLIKEYDFPENPEN